MLFVLDYRKIIHNIMHIHNIMTVEQIQQLETVYS